MTEGHAAVVSADGPGAVERSVPLEEASARVLRALEGLGLRPELMRVGETGDGPTAWRCRLTDRHGVVPAGAQGAGKGRGAEARVGAVFEALEHFLTGPASFAAGQVRLRRAGQVAGELAAQAGAVLLARTPDARLGCWRYAAPYTGEELYVPVFLSSPWYAEDSGRPLRERAGDRYDYRAVGRYASNSGSAIGVTGTEATVHALNEVIERDACSLLLTRAFLADGHRPVLIDPDALPDDLAELWRTVRDMIGAPVWLLDITTDVGVPTTMAYVAPTARRPHLRGSGTSLSPRYAAHRALTELLQAFLLGDNASAGDDPFAHLDVLRPYPALYRCGRMDLTGHLERAHTVAFADRPVPGTLDGHQRGLVEALSRQGLAVYRRDVRVLPGGITSVHVFVPGMENFGVVTQGIPLLPGPRAAQAARRGADR
ncbi:YcaO-like family protein [Streptomyces specialis]|uniref:YcaO-like family protein n=1 Tax=Streptomyces specialis TaxID=498367 RepID=UPI00073E4270|nr:YcaO-like family protein [Streptomyces specialis]